MKRLIIFTLCLCFLTLTFAQKENELGFFAGISYYMGDLNPTKHLYKPFPSIGLMHIHNLNKHYNLMYGLNYGRLQGSNKNNAFPQFEATSFKTDLIDATIRYGFNFQPFMPHKKKQKFTVFVSGGVGACYDITHNKPHFIMPFSVGSKYNLTDRIIFGTEWSFRKTFTDNLDEAVLRDLPHYTNAQNKANRPVFHDNDLYSFIGIFFTYRFYNTINTCPVYDE
jgi:hypothetical protein